MVQAVREKTTLGVAIDEGARICPSAANPSSLILESSHQTPGWESEFDFLSRPLSANL